MEHFIPKTLTCGEGWLMAGEIAHYAHQGVRSFIILQPFGCLPNHVCGRGVTKRLKEEFPGVQILPLDLDPDTSYANVENRLQMLIMNQTAEAEHSAASVEPAPQRPGAVRPVRRCPLHKRGRRLYFQTPERMPGAEVRPGYKEGSRSCERLPS